MPMFSIITVCYNAENEISKTMNSVLEQTINDFEYLIIDGASTDDTVKIASSFSNSFSEKGIHLIISSQKDSGIYSAMNSGTRKANGKWLLFLNAGDILCSSSILGKVKDEIEISDEIVYGDTWFQLPIKSKTIRKYMAVKPMEQICDGDVICHQSAFIRRQLLINRPYNESFRIAADYDFFAACYKNGIKFRHLPFAISIFMLGGKSSDPVTHLTEEELVRKNHKFISEEEYTKRMSRLQSKKSWYKIRKRILHIIPHSLFEQLQWLKYRKMGYANLSNENSDNNEK